MILRIIQTFVVVGILCLLSCKDNISEKEDSSNEKQVYTKVQQAIVDEFVYNCAGKTNYRFQHHAYQDCLNKGLEKDSTIAYLWQQKAMPYFKAKKYEAGMVYLDKAVSLDEKSWLAYRGFIKCIFQKNHKAALKDFERIKEIEGNSFVMDHTYNFYMGLSHLQLNHFENAEQLFKTDIEDQVRQWGENGYHHLDLFYYGISLYEQKKWKEALKQFDLALKFYPKFSDAMYYQSICLYKIGEDNLAQETLQQAELNGKLGNTINEDNAIYESYPYQITWY